MASRDRATKVLIGPARLHADPVSSVSRALIAVDDSHVYWTDQSGTVMRAPLAGGPPVAVVDHEAGPTGLAISPTCLYFADGGDAQHTGSIRSRNLD